MSVQRLELNTVVCNAAISACQKCSEWQRALWRPLAEERVLRSVDDARKASFEQAQDLGADLAAVLSRSRATGEPVPDEAASLMRALVSTTVSQNAVTGSAVLTSMSLYMRRRSCMMQSRESSPGVRVRARIRGS